MSKIIMLGTGNGGTVDLYNTCFVIQNNNENFLVDTGGGIEIIKRLKLFNIELRSLKHIFISHSHTDHILGIFWIFKKIWKFAKYENFIDKINIYCNENVYNTIKEVSKYILPEMVMSNVYKIVNFVVLNDGDIFDMCGLNFKFFDIKAKGIQQYGFETYINNKRLVF